MYTHVLHGGKGELGRDGRAAREGGEVRSPEGEGRGRPGGPSAPPVQPRNVQSRRRYHGLGFGLEAFHVLLAGFEVLHHNISIWKSVMTRISLEGASRTAGLISRIWNVGTRREIYSLPVDPCRSNDLEIER